MLEEELELIDRHEIDDDDHEDEDDGICPACAGSGEGMHDGSTCRTCNGRGE